MSSSSSSLTTVATTYVDLEGGDKKESNEEINEENEKAEEETLEVINVEDLSAVANSQASIKNKKTNKKKKKTNRTKSEPPSVLICLLTDLLLCFGVVTCILWPLSLVLAFGATAFAVFVQKHFVVFLLEGLVFGMLAVPFKMGVAGLWMECRPPIMPTNRNIDNQSATQDTKANTVERPDSSGPTNELP